MAFFSRESVGAAGESLAARFLKKKGYKLLRRNCRSKWGEIDLIMRDGDTVVFVEVKTRSTGQWGAPEDAVTPAKRRRIARQAELFANRNKLRDHPLRFDVVAVLAPDEKDPEIRHYVDAFTIG